jgi:hypothetical protein
MDFSFSTTCNGRNLDHRNRETVPDAGIHTTPGPGKKQPAGHRQDKRIDMKTRQGFTKKKKNRGLHGGTRSFWLRIQLSSVKLRVLRGEFLKFYPKPCLEDVPQIPMRLSW